MLRLKRAASERDDNDDPWKGTADSTYPGEMVEGNLATTGIEICVLLPVFYM
jgi:hypothetical protein